MPQNSHLPAKMEQSSQIVPLTWPIGLVNITESSGALVGSELVGIEDFSPACDLVGLPTCAFFYNVGNISLFLNINFWVVMEL